MSGINPLFKFGTSVSNFVPKPKRKSLERRCQRIDELYRNDHPADVGEPVLVEILVYAHHKTRDDWDIKTHGCDQVQQPVIEEEDREDTHDNDPHSL
mgnify:CR=1 FL=1